MMRKPRAIELLEKMLLIRRVEEQIIELGASGHLRGLYLVAIGQEAVATGVTDALKPQDVLFSTHRNHAHLLARGVDPVALIAEVLGRVTGTNGGRGGTYHPAAPKLGVLHTSAIVGSSLALAAGAALAFKRSNRGALAVAFIGDGVFEQGVAYETLNLASTLHLPLLIVCEDNNVPAERHVPGTSTLAVAGIDAIARLFRLPAVTIDGSDARKVRQTSSRLVAEIRRGGGTRVMVARITRWPGNFGRDPRNYPGGTDIRRGWMHVEGDADIATWSRHDPVVVETRRLHREGIGPAHLLRIDSRARLTASRAARKAFASQAPDPATALQHVFAKA